MIKINDKTISSIYENEKGIEKIFKGTLQVYEGWKNLIASGVPLLTLTKCKGAYLVDYKLYGNSYQETRSGRNLYNYKDLAGPPNGAVLDDDGWVTLTIDNTEGTSTKFLNFFTNNLKIKPSTNYNIILEVKEKSGDGSLDVTSILYSDTDIQGQFPFWDITLANLNNGGIYQRVLTSRDVSDSAKYGLRTFLAVGAGNVGSVTFRISVLEDITITPETFKYEAFGKAPSPDYPSEVESVGEYDETTGKYKIPVKVRGKNIFDYTKPKYSGFSSYTVGDNIICVEATTDNYVSANIPIENQEELFGETLTTSAYVKNPTNSTGSIRFGFFNGNSATSWEYYKTITIKPNTESSVAITFKIPTTVPENYQLCVALYGNASAFDGETSGFIEYSNIQVESGDKTTKYEPYKEPITTNIYLDEPLRKIDDYEDYIDFENKKVVRNIVSEFIDTVNSASANAGTYKIFLSNISHTPLNTYERYNTPAYSKGYAISNKFKKSGVRYNQLMDYPNLIQSYLTTGDDSRVAYTFDDSSIKMVSQAQEKIGDGFEVYYVIATPIEETIELPNIPTIKGTTILEVDTSILPSNMELVYKGKK